MKLTRVLLLVLCVGSAEGIRRSHISAHHATASESASPVDKDTPNGAGGIGLRPSDLDLRFDVSSDPDTPLIPGPATWRVKGGEFLGAPRGTTVLLDHDRPPKLVMAHNSSSPLHEFPLRRPPGRGYEIGHSLTNIGDDHWSGYWHMHLVNMGVGGRRRHCFWIVTRDGDYICTLEPAATAEEEQRDERYCFDPDKADVR